MWTRRLMLGVATLGIFSVGLESAQAAIPYVSGTYTAGSASGTITFTPVKRVIQYGYQGTYKINGKSYPGSLYFPRTGGLGMVWYYGTSGNMAGNSLCTAVGDGSYTGPLSLFDRNGNTTLTGTATIR